MFSFVVVRGGGLVQSVMNVKEMHTRHCLLHYFHNGRSTAKTKIIVYKIEDKRTVSITTFPFWFNRFRSGDFNLTANHTSGGHRKQVTEGVQVLLKLCAQLEATQMTVASRLHALRKIEKDIK